MKRIFQAILLSSTILFAGPIDNLKPGEWYEVPNSHLNALDPCPARDCAYSAVEGINAVINDWSGGAFDTKRNQLIVWGGGHGGYAGNEIYVFNVDSLKWFRVNNPSNPPAVDVAYATDGGPCSRHTYNYIQYIPSIDRFCTFGGAGFYVTGQTGTNHTDAFDFGAKTWSALANVPDRAYSIGSFSAIDPVTGHAWQHGCQGSSILAEYNPAQNSWIAHGGQWTESEYFSYYMTAAIDPVHRKFVAVGGGDQFYWEIDSLGDQAGKTLATTGDSAMIKASSPGFEWDPVIGKFVAWNGGADVYTLDMGNHTWTKIMPASTNTVIPTAHQEWGTFGRFRYSPSKNVYVAVNNVSENAFIYRLAASSAVANKCSSLRHASSFHVFLTVAGSAIIVKEIRNNEGQLRQSERFDITGKKLAHF